MSIFCYYLSHVCIANYSNDFVFLCHIQSSRSITYCAPFVQRYRVVHWRLEDGKTYRELAKLAGCSIGTIANILHYHHKFGQSTNPFNRWPGPAPLLNAGDMDFIDELLEREPYFWMNFKTGLRKIVANMSL